MTSSSVTTSLDDRLQNFMGLSNNLLTLIEHENAILSEMGEFTFENYIQKKVEIMRQFEKQAQFLLLQITEGSSTGITHDKAKTVQGRLLMTEIKRIREALTMNSAYQMDQIKQRTKARQEKFSAPLMNKTGGTTKDYKTCH
jgi:hypothetical protein